MNDLKRELYSDADGKFRWRIVARNARIIAASSESFESAQGARRNFDKVQAAMHPSSTGPWRAA